MKRKQALKGMKTLIFGAVLVIFAVSCGSSQSDYEVGMQAKKASENEIACNFF